MVLSSNFINMTFAENFDCFATVRTFHVTHIFDDTNDRNIHHLCHFDSFSYDHRYQFLWGGYNDDAVNRDGLEYSQRNITGSRRHIDKHIIDIFPHYILPKLFHRAGNDRTTPNNRICSIFQ